MFNGIIFNKGIINRIKKRAKGVNLFIKSSLKISNKNLGISISCDGVCLTLVSKKKNIIEFYLSNETLNRSKFKKIKKDDEINLELPLKKGQDISGHICQGHVDTTARLLKILKQDKAFVYEFKLKSHHNYLVDKASILINGVSLTVSKIVGKKFQVWLIPHTLKLTNLKYLKVNDLVNVELDIFGKYIYKYLN